jgi:hypothetical protein
VALTHLALRTQAHKVRYKRTVLSDGLSSATYERTGSSHVVLGRMITMNPSWLPKFGSAHNYHRHVGTVRSMGGQKLLQLAWNSSTASLKDCIAVARRALAAFSLLVTSASRAIMITKEMDTSVAIIHKTRLMGHIAAIAATTRAIRAASNTPCIAT